MTLGNMRKIGVQRLVAYCLNPGCRHEALLDVSSYRFVQNGRQISSIAKVEPVTAPIWPRPPVIKTIGHFGGRCRMHFIAIIFCAGLVAACAATSAQVSSHLGSQFVGQNVDALVTEFGPPANTFKMNSGETSYVWQLTSLTNIDTYKGSGTAQTVYCKVNAIASPRGIVNKISTEDSSNVFGESLCARRLGMQRS